MKLWTTEKLMNQIHFWLTLIVWVTIAYIILNP